MDHLDMLDAVAAVAPAIGTGRRFVTIENQPDGAVTDRVDGDLEAQPIRLDGDAGEMLAGE